MNPLLTQMLGESASVEIQASGHRKKAHQRAFVGLLNGAPSSLLNGFAHGGTRFVARGWPIR
jgi:hypothetical protein